MWLKYQKIQNKLTLQDFRPAIHLYLCQWWTQLSAHLLNMNIKHKSGLFGVSNYQRAKPLVMTDATKAVELKYLKGK